MASAPRKRDARFSPITPRSDERRRPPDQSWRSRPFDASTAGFWLGGLALGAAGCILAPSMPHYDPVPVTFRVLWWGMYLGTLGGGFGALIGMWLGQALTFLSRDWNAVQEGEKGPDFLPAQDSGQSPGFDLRPGDHSNDPVALPAQPRHPDTGAPQKPC
jgi:hypothetical protein